MKASRCLMLAAATLACGVLSAPVRAQAPVYVVQQPRYVYTTPAPRYVYRTPAPRYVYYSAPAQRVPYSIPQAPIRYYQPTNSFQRYRQAVDTGRDPNWASGRGVATYKPWEY